MRRFAVINCQISITEVVLNFFASISTPRGVMFTGKFVKCQLAQAEKYDREAGTKGIFKTRSPASWITNNSKIYSRLRLYFEYLDPRMPIGATCEWISCKCMQIFKHFIAHFLVDWLIKKFCKRGFHTTHISTIEIFRSASNDSWIERL